MFADNETSTNCTGKHYDYVYMLALAPCVSTRTPLYFLAPSLDRQLHGRSILTLQRSYPSLYQWSKIVCCYRPIYVFLERLHIRTILPQSWKVCVYKINCMKTSVTTFDCTTITPYFVLCHMHSISV